jgi:hypothetical protein
MYHNYLFNLLKLERNAGEEEDGNGYLDLFQLKGFLEQDMETEDAKEIDKIIQCFIPSGIPNDSVDAETDQSEEGWDLMWYWGDFLAGYSKAWQKIQETKKEKRKKIIEMQQKREEEDRQRREQIKKKREEDETLRKQQEEENFKIEEARKLKVDQPMFLNIVTSFRKSN